MELKTTSLFSSDSWGKERMYHAMSYPVRSVKMFGILLIALFTLTVISGTSGTLKAGELRASPIPADPIDISVLVSENPSCDASDGLIIVVVDGGLPGYTYNWSDGATGPGRSGLEAGTYSLTVTDSAGNTETISITLEAPCGYDLGLEKSTNFVPPVSQDDLISYTITVTNYGAVDSGPIVISDIIPAGMTFQSASNGALPVGNKVHWSISNIVSGAVTSVDIQLTASDLTFLPFINHAEISSDSGNDIDSTPDVNPYNDAVGEDDNDQVIVTNASCNIELDFNVVGASCFGEADGFIDLIVDGAQGFFTTYWSDGVYSQDRGSMPPGTYTVTVQDSEGCQATADVTVLGSIPMLIDFIVEHPECDADNGSVLALVMGGGTAPFEFAWSTGLPYQGLTGLPDGNYSLIVTDANGCSVESSVELLREECPCDIDIEILISEEPSCDDLASGLLIVVADGGNGDYTYQWSDGATGPGRSGLSAGYYSLTVSDSDGCTSTLNMVLDPPDCNPCGELMTLCGAPVEPVTLCPDFCTLGTGITIWNVQVLFTCGLTNLGDGCLRYTPVPGFTGWNTVSITACDDNDVCQDVQFEIFTGDCDQLDFPPVATDNYEETTMGQSVLIFPLADDYDVNGDLISFCIAAQDMQPLNGTVTIAGNGFAYTPFLGFYGIDEFTYTICDGNGGSSSATVFITVHEDCSLNNSYHCAGDGEEIEICVHWCLEDASITTVNSLFASNIEIGTDNCFTYQSMPGFSGQEDLAIEACNANGACEMTRAYVQVIPGGCVAIEKMEDNVVSGFSDELDTPKVFSPNGDGINERFNIKTRTTCGGSLKIFNVVGSPVFESDYAQDFSWDGSIQNNGTAAPRGTYYYILSNCNESGITRHAGFVELVR